MVAFTFLLVVARIFDSSHAGHVLRLIERPSCHAPSVTDIFVFLRSLSLPRRVDFSSQHLVLSSPPAAHTCVQGYAYIFPAEVTLPTCSVPRRRFRAFVKLPRIFRCAIADTCAHAAACVRVRAHGLGRTREHAANVKGRWTYDAWKIFWADARGSSPRSQINGFYCFRLRV